VFLLRLVFTDASRIYDCCRSVAGYRIQIEIIVIYRVYVSAKHSTYLKIPQARVMVFNIYIRYAQIFFFYPNAITKTRKLVLFIHSRPISNIKIGRSFQICAHFLFQFSCFYMFDEIRIILLLQNY